MNRQVGGWVDQGNIERLLEFLAGCVGYDFGALDWGAVETALRYTDSERADGWYDYPVLGDPALTVRVANELDAGLVMVRVEGELDDVLVGRIETAFEFL
ncbi:hypothetical protein OG474_21455 [Kribbella sp. NBC_01505]|uniref:hypothetical protein n=1 Tax=Kribbella sp. NBC_01505 TaxID=2903580 RepID=UPI00386C043F